LSPCEVTFTQNPFGIAANSNLTFNFTHRVIHFFLEKSYKRRYNNLSINPQSVGRNDSSILLKKNRDLIAI
jgi:hypothetical protein